MVNIHSTLPLVLFFGRGGSNTLEKERNKRKREREKREGERRKEGRMERRKRVEIKEEK